MINASRSVSQRLRFPLTSLLLIGLLVLGGCTAKKDGGQTGNESAEQTKTPPPVEPSKLPMGAVLARVHIQDHEDKGDYFACRIVIDEVVQYGPQSKPTAAGTEITAAIPKNLADGDKVAAWQDADDGIRAVLSPQEVMQAMKGQVPDWKVLEIR